MKFNIDKKFIDYVAYILIAISTIFIIAFLMHNKIITNFLMMPKTNLLITDNHY